MPADYYHEASEFYGEKEYDKALQAFQYIVDNHPRNELYPTSFYNTGYIYFIQKQFDKAIPVFQAIINGNFNDKDKVGEGIMDDPYANYKHKACEILCDIHYTREAYDSALYYFALSDSAYPYLHFCGNEYAANDVHTALKYADIYQKLKQPEKAISKLLPAVFIELANNKKVIDELQTLLKNETNLKGKLDQAVQKIYLRKYKTGKGQYERYYFRFLDTELPVPEDPGADDKPFNKEKTIKTIMASRFYKMIAQL